MEPTSKASEIPEFAKARINKAQGHINATERKLWHDTDRGLWSARQAKARLAEAWLWLKNGTEFSPLERYLARDVVQTRLEAFGRASMSDTVKAAWTEVAAAEQAILNAGFPSLRSPLKSPLKGKEREALEAGIARKNRYLRSLEGLRRTVEDAVAERFVNLRPGDWVRVKVKDGPTGRVLGLEGLTVSIFAWDAKSEVDDWLYHIDRNSAEYGVRRYSLLYAEITRVPPPKHPMITEPCYYWMLSAYDRFQQIPYWIEDADWLVVADVEGMLRKILDSAAKAWWATFSPGNPHVTWGSDLEQNVERLQPHAPSAVSEPLNRCLHRLRALTNERLAALPAELENWQTAVEEMLPLVEEGLTALELLLAPRVDLVTGDWVLSNHGSGRITARDDTKIVVDLGPCGLREVELFREFLQRIPSSGEEEQCYDI